ncbi:MAG: alpha/beta hydrolase fold domain-containing protein [Rhodopirellula sp.]|nr:alpha/beta hydrolase fold domain-containing protein [Rhodopirellula sp.]
MLRSLMALLLCVCFAVSASADEGNSSENILRDIEFSKPDGHSLKLDLYLPDDRSHAVPVVVFVHGGGWKNGSRKSGGKTAAWLTEHGIAVASVDYRLIDVAQWPAQINDCYDAVRWVREHADEYGLDGDHIGAWGTSAGGHLVALMGTRTFSGEETVSSRVQAVCDWFGPSELMTMPPNNVGNGRTAEDVANSNGAKLLGATVREVPELARDASGLDHVTSDDPPFLIMHGDKDPGVPLEQSQKLHAKLIEAGVSSRLHVVKGAGHGGKLFASPESQTIVAAFFKRTLKPEWNQGAGPDSDFGISPAKAPSTWSVVRNENILWQKTLPETGQSTVVTNGGRLFFTTMKPVGADSSLGQDIVAWCCDAGSGETIWTREIAADYPLRLSGCFSDSSSPPPVTDGERVCFFNASGRISCFDREGKELWTREFMPVGRTMPFLVDGSVVFIRQRYMPDAGGNFTHEHKNAPREKWTQLEAFDLATGKPVWETTCGSNMGCVPLLQTLSDGRRVIVVGRGGGHSPPESPEGISLVDATDGSTIWTLPLPGFMSTMTFNIVRDHVLVFHGGEHLWVNAMNGEITRRVSILENVPVREQSENGWVTKSRSLTPGRSLREIIQQSNILVGSYHYFRSYTQPWLGRVHVNSGNVEYLQLPVQSLPGSMRNDDQWLWTWRDLPADRIDALKSGLKKSQQDIPITQWAFQPNDMKNSRGYVVMGDARSKGNGWGHHASAIPTAIGDNLYVPIMSGNVYVLRHAAKTLDENALIAINDLGPIGQSWNRASISYSHGRLYAHTIGKLICIEK